MKKSTKNLYNKMLNKDKQFVSKLNKTFKIK